MIFNELTVKDLQALYPNNGSAIDFEDEEFTKLYNLYRSWFTQYIIELLELKKFDEKISKSELDFNQVNIDDMDVYQYFSASELKYLYLRNNIYLKRLTGGELICLKERLERNAIDFDQEAAKFINDTFAKVIFEDVRGDGKEYMTFYGPESSSFMAYNNSLIIGMRYHEFASNGTVDDSWRKRHDAQILDFLPELFYNLEANSVQKLATPVCVLKYNQFSIKRRKQEDREDKGDKGEEK